jgi:hypothetical protein
MVPCINSINVLHVCSTHKKAHPEMIKLLLLLYIDLIEKGQVYLDKCIHTTLNSSMSHLYGSIQSLQQNTTDYSLSTSSD